MQESPIRPFAARARVAMLIAAILVPAAAGGNRMTPELLWKLGRVSNPRPSADGRRVLFEITRYDLEANTGNSDVYVLTLADGTLRQLTTHEKSDSDAAWMPDGRVAFLAARDGSPQVWTIDPDGGEAEKLTDVKDGVANFAFSPDGTSLSFTSAVRLEKTLAELYPDLPKADARIIDGLLYRHWNAWDDGTYSHLMVRPVAGGTDAKAIDLMEGERYHTPMPPMGDGSEIAWSPDGKELCYTCKKVEHPESSTDSDLYLVPRDGGTTRNITEGMDGYDVKPTYSPDGKWIAFSSMQRAGFEADRNRAMLYERASGAIHELGGASDLSFDHLVWAPDSSALYAEAVSHGTGQVFRIGLDGNVTQLTRGRHDLGGIAVGPDGSTLYAQKTTMERPAEIVRFPVTGAADSDLEVLTHVNDAIFADLDLPTVDERIVRTKDGQDLLCWVIKPPGFDPAKKYPMLTYCQGGPQSALSQFFSYRWNFHIMAANGYVVVAPNRRGCPGFGQAWTDAVSRDWGGKAMQDYLDATDSMFGEPWVDRAHTAAVGASFGGYSVYWLMGHDQDDRFCAMIAHCGMFNTESWYGTTEELWFANWDVGEPYWTSPEARAAFDACSPHRFVGNWDTPLLVIHSEKDFRVPVAEGIQAFNAAQRRGIPSRFLYFPNECHWVSSPQNSVLWQRVFFDWLDRFCKPQQG